MLVNVHDIKKKNPQNQKYVVYILFIYLSHDENILFQILRNIHSCTLDHTHLSSSQRIKVTEIAFTEQNETKSTLITYQKWKGPFIGK